METPLEKSPLPLLTSARVEKLQLPDGSEILDAYNETLQAEKHAQASDSGEKKNLVFARVVGYLLLEFCERPRLATACVDLVGQINSKPSETGKTKLDVVFGVGEIYCDKFIRTFRTCTTPYPPPSSHPSRPSFESVKDMIKVSLEASSKDHRTARQKALARDGFQCVITGLINKKSLEVNEELRLIAKRDKVFPVKVQAAHILNESTAQGIDPTGADPAKGNKTEFAAGVMTILEWFGFSELVDAFTKSGGVHEVWNILSLQVDLHDAFDSLDLWFEETDKPHRYKICVLHGGTEAFIRSLARPRPDVPDSPMFVEFNSELERAPPPKPELLALHAVCARVAHMSGAAEYFDEVYRDAEEMKVLASDGTSASLLSTLISPFAVIEGVA